jgi:hypothetical protein
MHYKTREQASATGAPVVPRHFIWASLLAPIPPVAGVAMTWTRRACRSQRPWERL